MQRILLGSQLRRLREAKTISAEDAGFAIRASQSKISRMEHGRVGFKERDVADLLTLYGVVDEAERETFLELARQANSPAWWHQYSDVMPSWFEPYIAFEEASALVRCVESRYVPDLLQTSEYAHAIAALEPADLTLDDASRQTAFKLRRQRLLKGDAPTPVWFLLDEAVLYRAVGGPDVLHEQLRHLAEVGSHSPVTIQIVPSTAPRREDGPFVLLRFAEHALPDVVFVEHSNFGLYFDRASDVEWYVKQFDILASVAMSPKGSMRLIRELAERR
ncbi:helix-turn-helix transcriptional regulator [Spirillospora sp. NPDC049024]